MPDEALPPFRPIQPNPGGQLDLTSVIGRDVDVRRGVDAVLTERRHLNLDEPRRFGKTSYMRLLEAALEKQNGVTAIYRSLQGYTTSNRVVESVLDAVRQVDGAKTGALSGAVKSFLREVQLGPVGLSIAFEKDPLTAFSSSMRSINEALGTKTLVIIFDEFTEVLGEIGKAEGAVAARELLNSFRRIREVHPQIRWVLTGSIGFHHVLRQIGSTEAALGDMRHFDLGPLNPGWAKWLAGCTLWGSGITPEEQSEEVRQEIARVTDGIPILIHMIALHVKDQQLKALEVTLVERIMDECFKRRDLVTNVTHLLSRLDTYYDDVSTAEQILDHLVSGAAAQTDLLQQFPTANRRLLESLEADHYLTRDSANSLRWKYPVLARLWKIRRGI